MATRALVLDSGLADSFLGVWGLATGILIIAVWSCQSIWQVFGNGALASALANGSKMRSRNNLSSGRAPIVGENPSAINCFCIFGVIVSRKSLRLLKSAVICCKRRDRILAVAFCDSDLKCTIASSRLRNSGVWRQLRSKPTLPLCCVMICPRIQTDRRTAGLCGF